ncbi:hypothetical protein [Streptomyces caniscabiei]|uniref:Uncharacterized protein n=1 Tax=Streptomyces caniscabiei TaxID=2746961 RepID=A0ABU4N417_9ACTN|nr:hypothetical protein [Streptomyces caniscabiei]MBE4789939.1 hypothetical protein [Streptomyces caniscabiei]MBE4799731.1 hypothetical protein [Streptomyces caniscabiei]MDX2943320.1 hypothetical protein [Streptomyces caniscabiei]MDX3044545.1 hypothetical protein [Streptomyces caniscabiei]
MTTRQEQTTLAAQAAGRAADLAKETERAALHPDKRSLVQNLAAASTAWADAAQAHAAIAALLPETEA